MSIVAKLEKYGEASRSSGEYFNRDKGDEYEFSLRETDQGKIIIGYCTSYPDACPSDPSTTFYVIPLSVVKEKIARVREEHDRAKREYEERRKENPAGHFFDRSQYIYYSLLSDSEAMVSRERYLLVREQGRFAPVCEKCRRVIAD